MRWVRPLLGIVLLLPCATAEPLLHGWIEPREATGRFDAGASGRLDYTWHVAFENTTCTSAVEVGVDFIVEESPAWAGAFFEPDAEQTRYPGGQGPVVMEIDVDEDAPTGEGRFVVSLALNPFNAAGACTPVPRIRTEAATAHIQSTATTTDAATASTAPSAPAKRGTPAFEALAAVLVVALVARRLR